MNQQKAIVIPTWFWNERPATAHFCEMINEILDFSPEMSLRQFAMIMSDLNVKEAYNRIVEIEKKQFGGKQ